jgi:hypothetical protein
MPTLGTQTISSSYAQLLKTFSTGGLDGALQVITDGDNTSSALSLSTSGVSSTGSFTVSSNSSLLGPVTFGSNITASTGTATIGTETVNVSTIASATFGTARITGSTGGLTSLNTGSTSFSGATLQDLDSITSGSNITTGTFTVSGAAIGDIVFGGLTSLSSSSGTAGVPAAGARMMSQFRVEGANVVRYTILNTDTISHGTIPAGTIYATAIRVVA